MHQLYKFRLIKTAHRFDQNSNFVTDWFTHTGTQIIKIILILCFSTRFCFLKKKKIILLLRPMHWFICVALKNVFLFLLAALLSLQLAIFHDSDIFHDVSAMPQFLITLVPLVFDERRIKTNLCRSWWSTKIRDPKAINSSFPPSNWIYEREMREAKGWR